MSCVNLSNELEKDECKPVKCVVGWCLRDLDSVLHFHFDLVLDPGPSLCSSCLFELMGFTQVCTGWKYSRESGFQGKCALQF